MGYESSRRRKWHEEEGGLGRRAMNLRYGQYWLPMSTVRLNVPFLGDRELCRCIVLVHLDEEVRAGRCQYIGA